MDKHTIEGKWMELSGAAKEKWGELTDDEIQQAEGNKEKLIGIIQQKFGLAREEVEKEFDKLKGRLDQ
ncbi:CsbD family protein [Halomonas sp. DN3]|uniref:CsbD family protein n=1 Tax=Halomonas sp. DN3 TaxID=2953657 RepID=UPI00209E9AC9|nr:CsbD family protein [Halomonas sp. DN3]USZ50526.1 CsbD family protein [Halomonas sp. DN3]